MKQGIDNQPVGKVQWVDRNELNANDYNPNFVAPPELELLKTSIIEDGKEISYSYHRKVLTPDMDISSESDEIKALAGAIWTDAVKKAWLHKLKANEE